VRCLSGEGSEDGFRRGGCEGGDLYAAATACDFVWHSRGMLRAFRWKRPLLFQLSNQTPLGAARGQGFHPPRTPPCYPIFLLNYPPFTPLFHTHPPLLPHISFKLSSSYPLFHTYDTFHFTTGFVCVPGHQTCVARRRVRRARHRWPRCDTTKPRDATPRSVPCQRKVSHITS